MNASATLPVPVWRDELEHEYAALSSAWNRGPRMKCATSSRRWLTRVKTDERGAVQTVELQPQ